ncbi:hypothetical protein PHG11b_61 [Flavobacterium phage 11b]|uniref:hypothetical protein n=1 Tax=Flavobacterium phage 11b TaxID=294631 RepID=UPI000044415B|nr:hypothetical protein PHG11b_61 [Flavobacterium phage 11b]CAH56688.1 hypothetical protein PHG11b_61 [Flavobacterium phage 11b]
MKISELLGEVRELALLIQKESVNKYYRDKKTDNLQLAFDWGETKEGYEYWRILHEALNYSVISTIEKQEPKHYDNSKGSIYKFCSDKELNTYEFDIIKRVMRCRKKGSFLEDLEKTKFLIDLYIKEQQENN